MEAALDTIRSVAATADESGRRELMKTLHELAYSMEGSNDTIHRFGYLVCNLCTAMMLWDLADVRDIERRRVQQNEPTCSQ